MADVQADTAPERRAHATDAAAREGDGGIEAERRSFQAHREPAPPASGGPGQALAPAMAEAGLRAAERLAPYAGMRLWSRSVAPFYAMQTDMLRWMDEMWREAMEGLRPAALSPAMRLGSYIGPPPMDVKEMDQAYALSVELPGLAREDIDLCIQGDDLVLNAHKTEGKEDAAGAYRWSERRFGRFERIFPLPGDVDRGKVEASYRDGLLKIILPKTEHAERAPRTQVKIGA